MTETQRRSVVVYPHSMELGGSQLNALELAAAVRDRGHDVVVYGPPGELVGYAGELGLEFVVARPSWFRPSIAVSRDLARLCRAREADIVHAYEWPPAFEAMAAAILTRRPAALVTVMSMAVAPFLPTSMPLVVGTRRIQAVASQSRSGEVYLIEPPVDAVANRPGVAEGRVATVGAPRPEGTARVVIVSRLARELKLEGIVTAIRAVGRLASERPVQLVIVGEGPARDVVDLEADAVNAGAGREVVSVTGALSDPRVAYDTADVVVGMGGSALRAMAFAKPLIVQGERGFFEIVTPDSAARFLEQGWYGIGELDPDEPAGRAAAVEHLCSLLESLLGDEERRQHLGSFGRHLVEQRFSLVAAARVQEHIYERAIARRPPLGRSVVDGLAACAGLVAHKVRRRAARLRGSISRDDFNSKPV